MKYLMSSHSAQVWSRLLKTTPYMIIPLQIFFFDNTLRYWINTKITSWGKVISSCFEDYADCLYVACRLLSVTWKKGSAISIIKSFLFFFLNPSHVLHFRYTFDKENKFGTFRYNTSSDNKTWYITSSQESRESSSSSKGSFM